jgi:glucose/arabinose dehydrogenase
VTGGHVYRGAAYPALQGVYLCADFQSGRFWGIRHRRAGDTDVRVVLEQRHNIASFAEDDDGELYVAAFNGRIFRLSPK